MPLLHAVTSETFGPNAIGVGAIDVGAIGALPAFAPMALGLNVKCLIHGRAKHNPSEVGTRRASAG